MGQMPVKDQELYREFKQDTKMRAHGSGIQGYRDEMEDAHVIDLNIGDGNSFFAVFDGHGGCEVAAWVAQNIVATLKKQPQYSAGDYKTAFENCFIELDATMRPLTGKEGVLDKLGEKTFNERLAWDPADDTKTKKKAYRPYDYHVSHAGCTATCALVTADKIILANAGDSRTMITRNFQDDFEATDDHKPENEDEKARIIAAGGFVENARVDGVLAVSRCLGDFKLKEAKEKDGTELLHPSKQRVSCMPDYKEIPRAGVTHIFLACDGVWEVRENAQMAEELHSRVYANEWAKNNCSDEQFQAKVEEIIEECCCKMSQESDKILLGKDNISAVLVEFKR